MQWIQEFTYVFFARAAGSLCLALALAAASVAGSVRGPGSLAQKAERCYNSKLVNMTWRQP